MKKLNHRNSNTNSFSCEHQQPTLKGGSRLIGAWFCVFALAFIPGCSKEIGFNEEIILSDNTKIEISRVEHLRRVCEGLSCGWALDYSQVQIHDGNDVLWKKQLIPLLLDKHEGKYFLVATTIYCDDKVYGRPNPAYIQFEFVGAEWKRTELMPHIFGRQANLLIAPNWHSGESGSVSIEMKQTRNMIAGVSPYLKTLTKNTINNCN